MRQALFIIFLAFFLSSCEKDNEEDLYGDDSLNCNTDQLSFSINVMPIIKNSCATVGCHVQGGSGNGIFENYAQVKAKVDNVSFKRRVVVSQDMPPSGNLSACQIETIDQWISQGAINN